jgi:hypothetical protein
MPPRAEKKGLGLFPLLFALYPPLFLYANNLEERSPGALFWPLVLSLALGVVVWLAARLAVRDGARASITAFLVLVFFFTYGHLWTMLRGAFFKKARPEALLPLVVWLILLAALVFLVLWTKKNLHPLQSGLSLAVSLLIVFSLVQIVAFSIGPEPTLPGGRKITEEFQLPSQAGRDKTSRPDIYYLIFDRYANEKTLKKYYDFDNTEFLDWLRAKGFYVASDSRTNYAGTKNSLASSLNMSYMPEKGPIKERVFFHILQEQAVARLLQGSGYTYYHFGAWYEPTKYNRHADWNYKAGGLIDLSRDFVKNFLDTTLAGAFLQNKMDERVNILNKFRSLGETVSKPGPKFIFFHMLLPHHPYLFGPNGETLTARETKKKPTEKNYINQLKFTNLRIKELVERILAGSQTPPVIILQSDEGPAAEEFPVFSIPRDDERALAAARTQLRFRILNAYYLPGKDPAPLYPSISPVNTFRLIFDRYFGADFKLLEDWSYRKFGTPAVAKEFVRIAGRTWEELP